MTAHRILTLTGAVVMSCAIVLAAQDSTQGGKNEPAPPPAQDAPRPPRPQRVRVSQGVAVVVKKVPPKYPDEARVDHIEGTVLCCELRSERMESWKASR